MTYQRVDGSARKATEHTGDGQTLDPGDKCSGSLGTIDAQQVRSNTSNMRGGHRGSADVVGSSGRTDPSRDDVLTGSENVDERAVVREGGAGISNGRSSNGDNCWSASRRMTAGVGVGVTGGNYNVNTSIIGLSSEGMN